MTQRGTPHRAIRVPDDQWERWQQAAEAAGLDRSAWMRRALDLAAAEQMQAPGPNGDATPDLGMSVSHIEVAGREAAGQLLRDRNPLAADAVVSSVLPQLGPDALSPDAQQQVEEAMRR